MGPNVAAVVRAGARSIVQAVSRCWFLPGHTAYCSQ